MNNVPMTAKEYLSRAYRIDQRIERGEVDIAVTLN